MVAEPPISQNQPEFWADAPWRLEPDQDEIPLLFIIREANIHDPARGPWRLDLIRVEQKLLGDVWDKVLSLAPGELPDIDDEGNIETRFWTYSARIPLADLQGAERGSAIRLRVAFDGSFFPYEKPAPAEVHLSVALAQHALPMGRASLGSDPRRWFYGDCHYHSSYTDDILEFGSPVASTREAARAMGLDWLVVTDHSVDLNERDDGSDTETRWQRLKAELASAEISDNAFRCILGEEITLIATGNRIVHMLAIGNMDEMIPGEFLPRDGSIVTQAFQTAIEHWLNKVIDAGGYPRDTPTRLFGPVLPVQEVLQMLPNGTLAFAAHPFSTAQVPPARWPQQDLEHDRLTGWEFWNGRARRSAKITADPFSSSGWRQAQQANDQSRIQELRDWAEGKWERALERGAREWSPSVPAPAWRAVFIAGSDAHGSFNYCVGLGWDYRKRALVNDNALGRVRTAIRVPVPASEAVPEEADILSALAKGACEVTDGPILDFSLTCGDQIAGMGDALTIDGEAPLTLEIAAHTTAEFGPVQSVEIMGYFKGRRVISVRKEVQAGSVTALRGLKGQGYLRLQAETVGESGERFCCFTNPVWVRITGKPRDVQVVFG